MNASFTVPGYRCSVRVHVSGSVRLKPDTTYPIRYVSLAIHYVSLAIHYVSLAIHYVSLAIHYVSLAIHYVSLAIHYVSLAIHYVSLAIHYVSLAIHYVSLAIHYVSLAIRYVSLAYVVSAFRRTEPKDRHTTEPRTGNGTANLNRDRAARIQKSERSA